MSTVLASIKDHQCQLQNFDLSFTRQLSGFMVLIFLVSVICGSDKC